VVAVGRVEPAISYRYLSSTFLPLRRISSQAPSAIGANGASAGSVTHRSNATRNSPRRSFLS